MSFIETEEQQALREAVAAMAANYGQDYFLEKARSGKHTDELWAEAGKHGFLGVNMPEEYGGGGAGMYELSLVMEEMAANGCPLLMMVVSSAINGTIISKYGTEEQKKRWVPGLADGSLTMAFAITEPDAGSNSHRITTTARRDGSDWILSGAKVWISGVDQAQALLVVGRTEEAKTGNLRPALFVVPTDTPGLSYTKIPMELVMPESQFQVFLDEVRLPADALVGSEDAAIAQLFAGLNPERIMGAASAVGMGRLALTKADQFREQLAVWAHTLGWAGVVVPIAVAAIAAAAAGWIAARVPLSAGSGIQHVEAVERGEAEPASASILPARFIGGLLAIGAGGLVLGREGPTVHMGAAIGQVVGSRLRLAREDLRALHAQMAGAGLAVAQAH